jgi:hypothetical protein
MESVDFPDKQLRWMTSSHHRALYLLNEPNFNLITIVFAHFFLPAFVFHRSSSIIDNRKFKGKQKTRSFDQHYAALSGNHRKPHAKDDNDDEDDIKVKRES